MQVWTNTKTLDGLVDGIRFTRDRAEAEVILVGGKAFDLADFPKLRGIFKTGVGRDNIPEDAARAKGIICAFPSQRTCEYIYDETASFACYLVLRCLYSGSGDFETWTKYERSSLESRQVLVVGTGHIGKRVVSRLQSFARVTTYDVLTHAPEALEALVRAADCVTLHLPLTDQTRGLFDAEKLAWMKDGAALVNTARAAIVDETALAAELRVGRLRGAFDVFWSEPYAGPLRSLPADRFLMSPHVASNCREFREGTAKDFIRFLGSLKSK